MKKSKWYIYLTFFSLLVGLFGSWQIQVSLAQQDQSDRINTTLIDIIKNLEDDNALKEEKIGQLRQQIDTIRQDTAKGQDQLSALHQQLRQLKALVGTMELTGPGIILTLDDNQAGAAAAKNNLATYRPENYIIHDKNILYLVNEIKAAGAEAIAINNQRIVTGTDIRCVGTVIMVNSTRLAPPYEIRAIGNPYTLEAKLLTGEELPYLMNRDFPVKLVKQEVVTIPAYKSTYAVNHLQPVEEENSSAKAEKQ